MAGSHAAHARRGPRAVTVAEIVLAIAAAAVPTVVLTGSDSSAPAAARAPDAWSANRFVGNEATFDTGPGGWSTSTSGGQVNFAAGTAQSGTGSLAVTNLGRTVATTTAVSGSSATTWTPAQAGSRWIGQVSAKAGTTARAANMTLAFLDSLGRLVDQAVGQPVTDASSSWGDVPAAVGIAPPGTSYVVLQVSFAGMNPGETHYVDNALLQTASGGVAPVAGPLHTVGNQIVDANGQAIVFRGFNRSGLERSPSAIPTADEIAHAQQWGANFIRVHLGEQFWMPSTCYYDPTFPTQVDAAVNTITSRGMVALLSLSYNTITTCGSYGEQPMADAPNAITFWQQVAARYKNNPLVAFDLYNEPFNLTDKIWLNGGAVTWHGTTYQAAGMQQMYDAVRATGATNLVFISGNTWANWFPSVPVTGTNVVYAVHAYTCPQSVPPQCTSYKPYDPSTILKNWIKPAQTYPVMVTEFGWPDPTNGRYIRNVISYAESHGWGWAVFTWGSATYGPFDLLASAGTGANYEPGPTGMPALGGLPGS
jgi:hypothetical protein